MTGFWAGFAAGAGVVAAATLVAWIVRRTARPAGGDAPAADAAAVPTLPLDRVLDALDEAVLVLDPQHTIRLANAACLRFFPAAGAPTGRRLADVSGVPELDDLVAKCFAGSLPAPLEVRTGGEGGTVWRAEAALVESGGPGSSVRLILHDETERSRTDQIRREFVANASHELRTPLTIVRGYLENLLDGSVTDRELAHRFLKTARKHTIRLERLIEDMLSISRLESGDNALLRRKFFLLRKCLARVLEHLHTLVDQREATVTVEIDPAVGRILGDRFYWEQVFFNLIDNSLKNNPAPGLQIRIAARPAAGGGAELVVEDNGVGIPQAALPFVLNRFYRVHQEGQDDVPGTGLGLSIVKRAVEAHGGTLAVASEPGVRTTFRILLPPDRVAGES